MRFLNITILTIILATTAFSRTIRLRWDQVDDMILTYRVYWGTTSKVYSDFVDAGNRTNYDVSNLQENTRYYFGVTAVDFWGNESPLSNEAVSSGEQAPPEASAKFGLDFNYPNPFNGDTSFRYTLPEESTIHLAIYNSIGQRIKTLADGHLPAGRHQATWTGDSEFGSAASSGIYFCVLEIGAIRLTRTITLLR